MFRTPMEASTKGYNRGKGFGLESKTLSVHNIIMSSCLSAASSDFCKYLIGENGPNEDVECMNLQMNFVPDESPLREPFTRRRRSRLLQKKEV